MVSHWLGKCLCLIAALGVIDGHLMVGQTWAWMSMMSERAPEQGLVGALDSTFSGDSPCSMCCAIQEQRQDMEQDAPIPEAKPTAKFPPAMYSQGLQLTPPAAAYLLRIGDADILVTGRSDEPPLPPPRAS